MVRFGEPIALENGFQILGFNSSMVRFGARKRDAGACGNRRFNSSMVRFGGNLRV